MDKTFTASEVREAITWKYGDKLTRISAMLHAFADLLEAQERAEPVAWRTFDGEGNYDYRDYENNEHYRDWYVSRNGAKYANWVEPLYSHPASADAERLEEQRDDAFQQAVQEARRVWMDEFPCEAGHDHVTPFDQFLYGNRPCMEAQPTAESVTDAIAADWRLP